MNIKGKKILVTGGAGFIGSHTVDELIEQGADVVIIDNLSSGRKQNINKKARFYKMNIADKRIEDIVIKENPDIIYHFAFFVFVQKSLKNPLLDMDSIEGSIRILEAARKIKIEKFVFASSGFVYGNTSKLPVNEEENNDFVTPYCVSKQCIENYIMFYNKNYGLPYVILRYATTYGPRQVTGAMADYIRKIFNNKKASIWGDGNKTRDYVYIKDAVKANLLVLNIGANVKIPIFNTGTSREVKLNTIYDKISSMLKSKIRPKYLPDKKGDLLRYCLSARKLNKFTGWIPEYSLDDGLKETVEYWKVNRRYL